MPCLTDAAIASTAVCLVGGQSSFTTTTRGPGVSGICTLSSFVPAAWSVIVMVPLPPWKTDTQSENSLNR